MEPRCSVLVLALALAATLSIAAAYDPLDPNGNITIKWDIMSWTPDGYVVSTHLHYAVNHARMGHWDMIGYR
jgi:hypothetical protein